MNIRGRIVGTTEPVTVKIAGGNISDIGPDATEPPEIGGEDVWISPAICDVQVNGAGGLNYSGAELSVDDVQASRGWLYKTGTGLFCPTVTTCPAEQAIRALKVLVQACEASETTDASFVGFHVEGPYISSEDGPRGAHPLEHTKDPDWDEFQRYQEAAGGRIRILTLAPERAGALPFIERAAADGLIVSIGHSAADAACIRDAVSAGATMSTHLGNGSHATMSPVDNYIWEQLASDVLWAGIIPDTHHVPPSNLKCYCRIKQKERICLVSDVASIAGLPPGIYGKSYGAGQSEIHSNGKISLAGTPYLAGAATFLDRGIANVVLHTDATLADAIEMVTANPARLLGTQDRLGAVSAGREASLTVFRWSEGASALEIVATVVRGEVVYAEGA
jgi:N-acetylglucosamine-6-phosphate deacetylase